MAGYDDERAYWEARSPINRFGKYLRNLGWWTDAREDELRAFERQHAIKALNDAEALPNPHIKHLFSDVFDEANPILLEQAADLQVLHRGRQRRLHLSCSPLRCCLLLPIAIRLLLR